MNTNSNKSVFKRGQKLVRRAGNKLIPVTFLMSGPRAFVVAGNEAMTKNAATAIVTQEDGAIVSVPMEELSPME